MLIGAGADIALNDKWSARVEYLSIDYANRDVAFPIAAQHFDSSLALQTIRLGLDYKLGENAIDHDLFTKSITALRAGSVRISWSNNVHRTIRGTVSVTLYRTAEPFAQSGP